MSLLSKAFKRVTGVVNKAAKILPGISQALPSSTGLARAAGTLQRVSGVLQGAGVGGAAAAIPGISGPIKVPGIVSPPYKPVPPMSIASGGLPAFPGGGGLVKTGLPLAAAALAPAVIAGGRALVQRGAAAIAARGGLPVVAKKVANALGWVTVGAMVVDAAGNVMGRAARRQMNPLNQRAARRAIRRIKRVRKIAQSIERALPKSKSRRC